MAVEFVSAAVHYVEDLAQAVGIPSQAGDVVVVVSKANGEGDDRLRAALARQMTRLYPLGQGAYVGYIVATGPSRIDLSGAGVGALYGEVGWAIYRGGQVKGLTYRPSTYSEPTWPAATHAGPGFAVRLLADDRTGWDPPAPGTARAARKAVSIGDEVLADGVSPGELILDGRPAMLVSATVVVGPSAPSAPRITLPAQADFTLPQQLAWTPDGTQTAYQVRKVDGATTTYWNGTAWVASAVWVEGAATSVPITGTNGSSYTYGVRTRSTSSRPGDGSEATTVVKGVASPPAPTVTVSGVTNGKLNKLTTTVTVAGAAGAGGVKTATTLTITRGGEVLQTLSVGGGAQSASFAITASNPLPNNTDLVFSGRVEQDGVQLSPAGTAMVTVAAPTPAAPSLLWRLIAHEKSGVAGVRITARTSHEKPIMVRLGRAQVTRDELGRRVVGELEIIAEVAPDGGLLSVDDYAAEGEVVYCAQVIDTDAPPIEGLWAETAPVVIPARVGWLWDQQDPSTAVQVRLKEWGERSRDLRTSAQATIHSSAWHVTGLTPMKRQGSMTVAVTADGGDASPLARLLALLQSGKRLTFTLPEERAMVWDGSKQRYAPAEVVKLRPVGTITEEHWVQSNVALRLVKWEWVEQ